jgi:hypothetical protein
MLRSTVTPKRRAQLPRRVSISGGRKNAPSDALNEYSKLMKERTLDMAVDLVASARNESTNGRIKRDTMAGILLGLPSDYTRNMIYSREKKRRRVAEESLDSTNDIEITIDVPELAPAPCNKGGRPLGATNAAKRDREDRERKAKADAVETLLARWARREPVNALNKMN